MISGVSNSSDQCNEYLYTYMYVLYIYVPIAFARLFIRCMRADVTCLHDNLLLIRLHVFYSILSHLESLCCAVDFWNAATFQYFRLWDFIFLRHETRTYIHQLLRFQRTVSNIKHLKGKLDTLFQK